MIPERKVLSLEQLLQFRLAAQAAGKTVVHCHGCFDIVHPGHIHHLQHARSLGDVLTVSTSCSPTFTSRAASTSTTTTRASWLNATPSRNTAGASCSARATSSTP